MKKKTWIILISVIVFIGVGGFLGVLALKQKVQQTIAPVKFEAPSAIVSKGEIKSGIYTSGNVKAAESVEFPYDGSTDIVFYIKNGEEVKKGKLLFEIKNIEATLHYEESIMNRDRIQGELNSLKALPDSVEKVEQIKQKEMELKGAKNLVTQAKSRLDANKVYAPFKGIVTLSKDLPSKAEGPQLNFVRLVNPENLIISVPIEEVDYPKVSVGDNVNVSLVAYEGVTFTGTITYLGQEATNQGGVVSFPAIITLEPNEKILPGMSADVWVILAEKKDILVLPLEAILDGEKGEHFVTLVSGDGIVEQRTVKLGLRDDSQVEIIEGLNEGDMVQLPMMGEVW